MAETIIGRDNPTVPAEVVSQSLVVSDVLHLDVSNHRAYMAQDFRKDIAANGQAEYHLRIPSGTVVRVAVVVSGAAGWQLKWYENSDITKLANRVPLRDMNRNGATSSQCTFWEDCTVNGRGRFMGQEQIGASGEVKMDNLLLGSASRKTNYYFRVNNATGGAANCSIRIIVVEQ